MLKNHLFSYIDLAVLEKSLKNNFFGYNFENSREAEVGTTVLLAIPDVDKGRCELPNLKCVVLEKTGGGMYR